MFSFLYSFVTTILYLYQCTNTCIVHDQLWCSWCMQVDVQEVFIETTNENVAKNLCREKDSEIYLYFLSNHTFLQPQPLLIQHCLELLYWSSLHISKVSTFLVRSPWPSSILWLLIFFLLQLILSSILTSIQLHFPLLLCTISCNIHT